MDQWLRREVSDYGTYRIFVNDMPVQKPYSQNLPLRKSKGADKFDELEDCEKFDILDRNDKIIARGWYGIRKSNIGQLAPNKGIDSLRIRVGNILIGGTALSDQCFQEARFNGYLVGEIHVTSPALVPNARRDDFLDSEMKSDFFAGIRNFVAPLVQKMRADSQNKNNQKPITEAQAVITTVSKQIQKGFVGDAPIKEKLEIVQASQDELEKLQRKTSVPTKSKEEAEKKIEKLQELEQTLKETKPSLTKLLNQKFKSSEEKTISMVLDAVYSLYDKSSSAQELVDLVIKKINRLR